MTTSISSSAILVDVTIKAWTARKLDKAVTDEVNTSKSASAQASRVSKNLLAGTKQIDDIMSHAKATRHWIACNSLPWSDFGPRLIPTAKFFEFKQELDRRQQEFYDLVDSFVQVYPTLISAQAFQLGGMFNRDEYPTAEDVAAKFGFYATYSPLPESGDFRLDIQAEAMDELREQYEQRYAERIDSSMGDLKQRLLDAISHLSDRMEDEDDGKRKRFHSDILDRFAERVAQVRALNITKDEVLDAVASRAEQLAMRLDIDTVKDSATVRRQVKAEMDSLLDKFSI